MMHRERAAAEIGTRSGQSERVDAIGGWELRRESPRPEPAAAIATPPELDRLLAVSSRTFALTIPLLPEPTRCEVTVAYLLFRVADTLEDSTRWSGDRKRDELDAFGRFLASPSAASAQALSAHWEAEPPVADPGYRELLADFPLVTAVAATLGPRAGRIVTAHTQRTVEGMAAFVARESEGRLRLRDTVDLKAYCYAVAGIVGEMLTELFLLRDVRLASKAGELRRDARTFGEALQLVNILKDASLDSSEGRHFLPPEVPRAELFRLAREDLRVACRYIETLEGAAAHHGVVSFTALPVLLATATLDCVEVDGPGSKIGRAAVAQIVAQLERAVESGDVGRLLRSH